MPEKHEFLTINARSIYTVITSIKKNINKKHLVILLSPVGEEKIWSNRQFVSFCRFLGSYGFYAVRFDYPGNGESSGYAEETGLNDYLSSISGIIQHFQKEIDPDTIGIISLRFGSLLAMIMEQRSKVRELINYYIMWDPVLNFYEYFYDALRANLTSQMLVHKKVIHNRDFLIESLENGESVEIEGFNYSQKFYNDFKSLKIEEDIVNLEKPIKLLFNSKINKGVKREKLQKLFENQSVEVEFYDEIPFWYETKYYMPNLPDLFDKTLSSINKSTNRSNI